MTTPTREQVASWWLQANVYAELQTSDRLEQVEIANERFATLAMSAGRDQGLREAKEVCERERVTHPSSTGDDYAAYDEAITDCAAAIDQLRGR